MATHCSSFPRRLGTKAVTAVSVASLNASDQSMCQKSRSYASDDECSVGISRDHDW